VELARRWATLNRQRVLFLAYNLAFTEHVAGLIDRLVARRKLPQGAVTVRAWETLARELLEQGGSLMIRHPMDRSAPATSRMNSLPTCANW
jgi:hypothetical protein